nr:retrovirus-related Pol polyprotein from transposon TNT 1-94 [Tanacetum cinerariifolium]
MNQSVATPPKKTIASNSTIQKSNSYYRMLYEKVNKASKYWIEKQCPSRYIWVPKIKMKWVTKVRKEDVKTSIGSTIDNASRITNVLKLTNTLGSNLSNVPSSSNSLADCAKASPTQAWLWHQRLSYLNLDTINLLSKKDIVNDLPTLKYVKDQLCLSCELSKAKRSTFKTKIVPNLEGRLNLLHMDLCGPMRIEIINGKKYIMMIVDGYSR